MAGARMQRGGVGAVRQVARMFSGGALCGPRPGLVEWVIGDGKTQSLASLRRRTKGTIPEGRFLNVQRRGMEPMSQLSRRFLGLCLPPAVVWSIDCILTLCSQSNAYWEGIGTRLSDPTSGLHYYAPVNEVSPTSHFLLVWHPTAYVAGTGLGIVFV